MYTRKSLNLRVSRAVSCGLVVLISGWAADFSRAGLFTLVDENSSAQYDTDSQANAFSWIVDGESQLYQQAFWYRIGNTAESSLDTLPHPVEGVTDTNFDGDPDTLFVQYDTSSFRIAVRYVLIGGQPGSRASDIQEQISISNRSGAPLDFHFFQYSDFDLNGTPGNDLAVFTNVNAVVQSEGAYSIAETVLSPAPSHREINYFPAILGQLTDLAPTTLSDSPAIGVALGPANVTWAYQWDFTLPVGGSFIISKDKNLYGIPEPATCALIGIALAFVGRQQGRRR